MSLSLRPPLLKDYSVMATWITDEHSCSRWAGPRLQYPFEPEALPQLLAIENSESFSLSDGNPDDLLGFGQVWFGEPLTALLMRIIISPKVRGKGLGRELCTRLIARAMERRNIQNITLRVYRDNTAALALYRGMGFSSVTSKSSGDALFMRMNPVANER